MLSWLRKWFRSAPRASTGQAHLTFGATSVGRSLSQTGLLLRKQLWIWPIIAVVLLASIGFGIRVAIERTMEANLRSQLETLLNVERSMLETWLKVQESNAESLANNRQIRELTAQIVQAHQPPAEVSNSLENATPPSVATESSLAKLRLQLAQDLTPGMMSHDFVRFILADEGHRILAASSPELLGQVIPEYDHFLSRAMNGEVTVSPPFPSVVLMKDDRGRMRTGLPTMFVCAPIRDQNLQVIAALGLRIRPEREFTRIVQLGQMGESGETYAVDKSGLFLSSSRFDEQLILLGILPDLDDARSILTISARDPGGNLSEGFRPQVRRSELPLTHAAAAVVSGSAGVNLKGYNDYRGVPVVGAWQWLPKYQFGLITEMDYAEAYRPLTILRWSFFSMLGLLTFSSVAIFVFTLVVARLQREAQKAVIEAKHLGQYRLEEKLGAGAMGGSVQGAPCHAATPHGDQDAERRQGERSVHSTIRA